MSAQPSTVLTKENLQGVIKERKDTYRYLANVMSVYNHERSTAKDYDGRQILELLQNADDAGASRLEISLDEENEILRIYNDGRSFSLKGMTSILVPDDSEEKVSQEYIGNKGLGFRSLITWADEIILSTSDVKLVFSKEVAKKRLEELGHNIDAIRKERNISSDNVPFPILGIPDVFNIDEIKGSLLEIKIKQTSRIDIKKNIRNQMNSISGETLFFLRNVKTIKVNKSELTVQRFDDRVEFNGNAWHIESEEDYLPKEYQSNAENSAKYSIKIAVPERKELNAYPIYNFLPTKIILPFPYIIHATLDVNSSRDYITSGENTLEGLSNKWILGKVAEVIKRCVERELQKGECDWSAYSMLVPHEKIDNIFVRTELGSKLEGYCNEMSVFPTICGKYVKASSFWFYDNDKSAFWKEFIGKIELSEDNPINRILKECPFFSEGNTSYHNVQKRCIPSTELQNAVKEISEKIQNLESVEQRISCRADLISHLVKYKGNVYFQEKNQGKINIPLLVDDDENPLSNVDVYTPKNEEYSLPFFVNIVFMNKVLYDLLCEKLENEIEKERNLHRDSKDNSESVQRSLARMVNEITKLKEYDKNVVEKDVVSKANERLKQEVDNEKKLVVIKEMVRFFKELPLQTSLENVMLIDENMRIKSACELFYPTDINRDVFGNRASYVCDKDFWNFSEENEYERIMSYLGVNCFTEEISEKDLSCDYEYMIEFWAKDTKEDVRKIKRGFEQISDKEVRDKNKKTLNVFLLSDSLMQMIKRLPTKKIVLFLCENNLDGLLEEVYRVPYSHYSDFRRIQTCNAMCVQLKQVLRYQILNENIVLDGRDDAFLKEFGISEDRIEKVYKTLSTDVDTLTPEEIVEILDMYSYQNSAGKHSRDLYKLIVSSMCNRNLSLDLAKQNPPVKLWSGDSENRAYHDANKVYYSDNETIPKNMIRKMGLYRLDYQLRAGTSKVCEALGLKRIDDYKIKIEEKNEVQPLSTDFKGFFDALKPYFLLLSLENVKDADSRRSIINNLKKCDVKIVDRCVFKMGTYETFELLDGEVGVDQNGTYYLMTSGCTKLSDLKENYVYCNAVAEIVCMALKIVQNDEFVHIVQNEVFMKQMFERIHGKSAVEECCELLGISNSEKKFWNKVFHLTHCSQPVDESTAFFKIINDVFEVPKEMYSKVDFLTWKNAESWTLLNNVLKKLSQEDRQSILDIVTLKEMHLNCFANVVQKYRSLFFNALWDKCNSEVELRSEFLKLEREYGKLIYENSELDSHKFVDDYSKVLQLVVKEKFGIDLQMDCSLEEESLKLREKQNAYDENFAKIIESIESLTNADLADYVYKNETDKSLLYFEIPEGIEVKIKEYLEKDVEETSNDDSGNNELTETIDVVLEPLDDDNPSDSESKGSGSEKEFNRKNKNNAKAGKEAENIAYSELKKTFSNLVWHSENSNIESDKNNPPPLGIVCDMWNSDPVKGNTYFEVKSESSDFKMSIREYDSMKKNPDRYEVVLVNRETRKINRHKFAEIDKLKKPFTFIFRFKMTKKN